MSNHTINLIGFTVILLIMILVLIFGKDIDRPDDERKPSQNPFQRGK